jgi:hypothetical protein
MCLIKLLSLHKNNSFYKLNLTLIIWFGNFFSSGRRHVKVPTIKLIATDAYAVCLKHNVHVALCTP